jgi:formylglycine-generating enzyme required for sulfatase activity
MKRDKFFKMMAACVLLAMVAVSVSCKDENKKKDKDKVDGEITTYTAKGVRFDMVFAKGKTFTMGCSDDECSETEWGWELPTHSVTLKDFSIGKFPVTQELWKAVMGDNPSGFKGDNLPVEMVSWEEVQKFITKLNSATGKKFRLPTEAEWEFAARGGSKSNRYKYSGSNDADAVAWYVVNGENKTHPVGAKEPNELGLYDMSGNVWEWCSDWYKSDYYAISPQNNPQGPSSGLGRVVRGGSWYYIVQYCRVANRFYYSPGFRFSNIGFRLVLP